MLLCQTKKNLDCLTVRPIKDIKMTALMMLWMQLEEKREKDR